MADTAMTVLLESLSQTLVSCSDLISGAEDELHLLRDEVDLFRNFFRDAARKPTKHESFRETETQMEELIYDAQDIIDSAAAQSKINLRPRRHVLVTETVRRLAEDVRSFREKKVNPVLDMAIADFPNMLLIGYGSDAILEQPVDLLRSIVNLIKKGEPPEKVLPENISNLVMILGGDRISSDGEQLRLLKDKVELLRVFLQNAADEPKGKKTYRKMQYQIQKVVVDAKDMIKSYTSQLVIISVTPSVPAQASPTL